MRTLFTLGLNRVPFGAPSGIPVHNLSRAEVDRNRAHWLRQPTPPGMTTQYPYIVKIAGEGEYVVNADGTASFYSYRYGRWEPPQKVDDRSFAARMWPDEE